ncbi:MAG: hypothetical protein AB7N53_18415 [Candidatus Binatia bacterium]
MDAFGRVKKTELYQGAAVYMTTEYTYDGMGREKSVKLNGTTLKTVSYDSLGRKTTMTDVNTDSGTTAGTWSYNYDMNGNVIRQNDPKTNSLTARAG